MQRFMDRFSYACKAFGLEISLKKTVVMHDPAPGQPYVEPSIYAEDKNIVHSFVYLGSPLTEGRSLDKEIYLRIEKASGSFSNLEKRAWPQHDIKLETKLLACVLTALLYASETWVVYRHQLKILKRFHQRCLRHILHIRWASHTPDTEVLEWASLPNIESMVMKNCLRWSGHLARMNDTQLPKQLFYGELREGKRKASKPKFRYKDSLKSHLGKCNISQTDWETVAQDRKKWRKTIHLRSKAFENSRVKYASFKCSVRKGEQAPAPCSSSRHVTCDVCGKLCLSLTGVKSHLHKHSRPATDHNIIVNKNDRQCPVCGKVCCSLAGLKSHLRVHAI